MLGISLKYPATALSLFPIYVHQIHTNSSKTDTPVILITWFGHKVYKINFGFLYLQPLSLLGNTFKIFVKLKPYWQEVAYDF